MKYFLTILFGATFFLCCESPKRMPGTGSEGKSIPPLMNTQADKFQQQFSQGIDFIASGTEPFWTLSVDFDKTMQFKTVSGSDLVTPAVKGVKAMDADVTRYMSQSGQGTLIVQLARRECTNSMSGEKFAYSVTVDVTDTAGKEAGRFEGCGQYLSDYRINDIWVLESINNKKLDPAEFTKGLPRLEINLAQQKVFGHTGCNNITGAVEVQGKRLRFGYLAGTRLACPNLEFENRYLAALSLQTIPYIFKEGKLSLRVNADSTFTYQKTD